VLCGAVSPTPGEKCLPERKATVNKPAIAILSIAAIVLNVIAFVKFGPAFATQLRSCQSSTANTNLLGCITSAGSAVDIGFALYLGGVIAAIVAWVMGLIKTARIRRWGWFAAVLLLPVLGSLLYGVAGPTTRAK
jgi:hypothetical protein